MIQCDYKALIDYASLLNKQFNQIMNAMTSIESSYKNIVNTSNWNSVTRNYYNDTYKKILANYNNLANKFNNINLYLDQVISNYIAFEQTMTARFGG